MKTRFEVIITMSRHLLDTECHHVERVIKRRVAREALYGGLSEDDIKIEVVGPHSFRKHLAAGTKVRIKRRGEVYEGYVDSATNYGSREHGDDWYIEMHTNLGYYYWKQGIDGGTMEVLDDANN